VFQQVAVIVIRPDAEWTGILKASSPGRHAVTPNPAPAGRQQVRYPFFEKEKRAHWQYQSGLHPWAALGGRCSDQGDSLPGSGKLPIKMGEIPNRMAGVLSSRKSGTI